MVQPPSSRLRHLLGAGCRVASICHGAARCASRSKPLPTRLFFATTFCYAQTMESVDRAARQIEEANTYANQSGAALADIVTTVESTADQVNAIATASEQQSAASDEINGAIALISEMALQTSAAMQFWQDKAECPPHTLFLGFGKIRLEDIPDCVARLRAAWAEWLL